MKRIILFAFVITLIPTLVSSQELQWEDYEPKSTLVVPGKEITRAKYPFVDVHSHLRRVRTQADVDKMVAEMDALNLQTIVNLSGGSGDRLKRNVELLKTRHPKRFVVFANVSFRGVGEPGWGQRAAAQLEADVRNGAEGLKIFKNLGLTSKDTDGKRIPTDDPRLEPLWDKAGELGIPVLIHTGEPKSFFDPHDRFNERWFELKQFPSRARPADRYPPWSEVMAEQHRMFAKHRKTIFINAHFGWLANDLNALGRLLDEHPNVVTEVAAIVAELGRQPRFAREFFIKYQDRVLFGKDTYRPKEYHTYFRIFESSDEYFPIFENVMHFGGCMALTCPTKCSRSSITKMLLGF